MTATTMETAEDGTAHVPPWRTLHKQRGRRLPRKCGHSPTANIRLPLWSPCRRKDAGALAVTASGTLPGSAGPAPGAGSARGPMGSSTRKLPTAPSVTIL
ncbi:hypothetical protein SAMN05421879_10522 [Ornithinimicrobium cerasi]|uniref:Uncharacterized protein n=1 Tax=Ornithinimicrobium cerasi TaxID=2248773 RepID=A0A285VQ02_9MICO|nr:hypothetical protein SAMN05421879_10522 [Ornithinimicrobium cerasi]